MGEAAEVDNQSAARGDTTCHPMPATNHALARLHLCVKTVHPTRVECHICRIGDLPPTAGLMLRWHVGYTLAANSNKQAPLPVPIRFSDIMEAVDEAE
jgi:hypothetical protein